ncbi:LysM peptidoglycan-binding domain-containing protein [Hespellia stercorisuis]|uniref:LysM repeat-containing protein n=1 Tax=Hespellia stercorisuis DSM 15480 TaxID=1121950 RepID=A0A1M6P5K8_9FIRM|nr:LysM peptidoglycan-binding domain-containing protein [Hespellia stercorisuis]SHK03231.1 LysM repeat-containing protein [Hespellia stercorisuis DSM 15480]
MERQLPKNVRQIGNVSDSPKIYIEDYVDTFLNQLCEKTGQNPQGAFLIGEQQSEGGLDYIFIYGAIRMHAVKRAETSFEIDEETWKNAYEDCKQYFEDGEMLGWYITVPGGPVTMNPEIEKMHRKAFPKKNSVLILEEPAEREEALYVNKYNDLMEIGGHYVYYEKNPCMQNYMISARKKNGVTPSETVEDRAAKDFRSLVRTRGERQGQKRGSRAMYAASAILVLIVVIMGITTINNFDKMKTVQHSLESITSSVSAGSDQTESKKIDEGQADKTQTDADKALENADAVQAGADMTNKESETVNPESGAADAAEVDAQETMGGIAADSTAQQAQSAAGTDGGNTADTAGSTANSDGTVSGTGVYVVESGDTLAIISQKSYGDVSHVDAICRMNGLTNGNLIYVGQKLLLP